MWVWLDPKEFVGGCPFRDSRCRQKLQPFTVTWGQKEWQDKRRSGETTDLNNEAGGVVWGHHVGGLGKLSFLALPGEAWRDNHAVIQTSAVKCTTPLQCERTVFKVYGKKDIRVARNVFKKMYAGSGVSKNRERTACMLHAMHSSEILRCMHVRTCDCVRSSIVIRRYVLYISSVHLSELSE